MKKSKTFTRLAAVLLAGTMMFAMGTTAFAEEEQQQNTEFAYTQISGSNTAAKIKKYLIMNQGANVPNATFSYSITAGTYSAATTSTPEIKAGIGSPSISSTVFEPGDTTYSTVQSGDSLTLGTTEKYAVEEAVINFSSVKFAEPGIYRYLIKENTSNVDGVTDASNTIYLDVYVIDKEGSLSIDSYVLHKTDAIPTSATEKVVGFENKYATKDLTFDKSVTGNQGSKSMKFTFTVNIDGADKVTKYDVFDGKGRALASITTDAKGKASATYALQDGESIVIKGLTDSTSYTITEDDYSNLGYTTTVDSVSGRTKTSTIAQDYTVNFVNNKQVSTPTGIITNVLPYVLMVVTAAGLAFVFLRKREYDR